MPKKLTNHFSVPFTGNIWRMLAAPQEGMLVLEIREGMGRKVNFAAIDFRRYQILWHHLPLPQTWWISVVHLQGKQLYLQTYPDSQTPQPNGLVMVDILTGKVQWHLEQVGFLHLSPAGLLVYQPKEEPIYQLIDSSNGVIIREMEAEEVKLFPSLPPVQVQYPVHYTAENKYFSTIAQFMQLKLGIQAQKAFDYMEYKGLIIISYYIYSNNQYTNFLLVLDQEANVLLQELLAKDLQGIGLDTFFIVENRLIFVKEKTELVIYEL